MKTYPDLYLDSAACESVIHVVQEAVKWQPQFVRRLRAMNVDGLTIDTDPPDHAGHVYIYLNADPDVAPRLSDGSPLGPQMITVEGGRIPLPGALCGYVQILTLGPSRVRVRLFPMPYHADRPREVDDLFDTLYHVIGMAYGRESTMERAQSTVQTDTVTPPNLSAVAESAASSHADLAVDTLADIGNPDHREWVRKSNDGDTPKEISAFFKVGSADTVARTIRRLRKAHPLLVKNHGAPGKRVPRTNGQQTA